MDTANIKHEELISQIKSAFKGVEKPEITLRVARGADDNRWDELGQLRKLDGHYKLWTGVPDEDIEKYQDVFPWLCPIGFRFYLPAFMIHSLRHSSYLAGENWLFSAFGELLFQEADIEILDQSQKRTVFDFLVSVLASVKDDYNPDWWNHPWDPEWQDDAEKEHVWKEFGRAFTFLKDRVDVAMS